MIGNYFLAYNKLVAIELAQISHTFKEEGRTKAKLTNHDEKQVKSAIYTGMSEYFNLKSASNL